MRRVAYTVVLEKDEDGYVVTVPALAGLVTEGRTLEEARRMAEEAIRCHVESLIKDGEPVPEEHEVNLEKVAVEMPFYPNRLYRICDWRVPSAAFFNRRLHQLWPFSLAMTASLTTRGTTDTGNGSPPVVDMGACEYQP